MKKRYALLIPALAALVLNGCFNFFLEKFQDNPGGKNLSAIPQGFSAVRVALTQGAARTVMPTVDLAHLYPEYRFAKDREARKPRPRNRTACSSWTRKPTAWRYWSMRMGPRRTWPPGEPQTRTLPSAPGLRRRP